MVKPEEKIFKFCQKHNLTLALAESCTGGAFAARLTKISGASKYFAGSIVSYQNKAKTNLLNISEAVLKQYGAVSQEVAKEMLTGALSQFSADIAVAVTGIAGPEGGTIHTPVGTVYIALGGKDLQTKIIRLQLEGSREFIIQKTVDEALLQLIQWIKGAYKPL